ncbi:hypothetical protein E4U43_001840 [Claviceps pusilla]|uniref:Uncharacterized protein n=1 Tax=Claviceps pusilla TaxID=123648 RepID=A0A9P7NGF6_9HYPO|nr:hypothetical protein E4U43_001840 [Claviceps pusilla]
MNTTDAELQVDVQQFVTHILPSVKYHALLRVARVGKDIRLYDEAARQSADYDERNRLLVTLTNEEKTALRREKDKMFSESGMLSSFNGASMYKNEFGLIGQSVPNAVSLDD